MKIIREKSTKKVIFYFSDADEIILSDTNLSGKYTSLAVNNLDFEIIENVEPLTLPVIFGNLIYDSNFYPENQAEFDAAKLAYEAKELRNKLLIDISDIELSITPRRIREAILGTDGAWLEQQEAAIAALRAQL